MSWELWAGFVAATLLMLAIPGPTILLVIGQSLGAGRRHALPLVAGVALGDLTAITLSLAGLGALMAASAAAFTVFKLAGAAYLVWLGVRLFRAPVEATALPPVSGKRALRDAFVVTALNPKSIAFFVAFLPQFMDATAPFWPQALVLVPTFVSLAALNALIYALLAGRLSGIATRPAARRWFNRLGGSALVGAGIATAAMRRA